MATVPADRTPTVPYALSPDELNYFHRRAEEEIVRAAQATDGRVVAFHYALGNLYLERIFGQD